MTVVTDVAPAAGSAQHGRRSLTVEQRRAEILEATRRVVLARGFGHTRIADVAAELGVSTGLIHYHFASKDALLAETLRVKAWLAVSRNQTRDYLDVAALADRLGTGEAAAVLARIDDYYREVNARPEAVATQLVRQLADPRPRDGATTERLVEYKALDPRWHDWAKVKATLADLARAMVGDGRAV